VLSGATVADFSSDPKQAVGLPAALAMIAGGVLLAAGLARLGFITNFLAELALDGFLFGLQLAPRDLAQPRPRGGHDRRSIG
jgi:MFS superfamily sulfate permease-like transporter